MSRTPLALLRDALLRNALLRNALLPVALLLVSVGCVASAVDEGAESASAYVAQTTTIDSSNALTTVWLGEDSIAEVHWDLLAGSGLLTFADASIEGAEIRFADAGETPSPEMLETVATDTVALVMEGAPVEDGTGVEAGVAGASQALFASCGQFSPGPPYKMAAVMGGNTNQCAATCQACGWTYLTHYNYYIYISRQTFRIGYCYCV